VVAYGCEERTTVDGIGYPCVKLGDHVEHTTALGASWWVPVETPTEEYSVIYPDDAGAAAAEAAEPWAAEAAYREAYEEAAAGGVVAMLAPKVDDGDVNEFDESELGDVADEAIGDAATLASDLERAERVMSAIAEAHRPVAAWTRRRPAGLTVDIEYQTDCCLACRDANGNPVPSPCTTMVILNSFGEA
jgi:hypothetical protein